MDSQETLTRELAALMWDYVRSVVRADLAKQVARLSQELRDGILDVATSQERLAACERMAWEIDGACNAATGEYIMSVMRDGGEK